MDDKLLVANFKMNKTRQELKTYFETFPKPDKTYPYTIVFCPPYTGLSYVSRKLRKPMYLGAQNVHYEEHGAFTGEISAPMLKELKVKYVLIGHRERRFYNFEANRILNLKIKTALAHGLKVILCVGEDAEQHEQGKTKAVLMQQINTTLQDIDDRNNIYIAYEPVWAIGSGTPASVKEINEICNLIKQIYNCPVLYGGSVKENNVGEILQIPNIDGVLVGGACLNPLEFARICEVAATI